MLKILSIFGTRPEAIKMAPVIEQLRLSSDKIISRICVTAQHREMLDQVLSLFKISPDIDLNIMKSNQSLADITRSVLQNLEPVLNAERPDWVLVQGDTTTVMAASLLSFYKHIKIGHVEAGLRTYDRCQPFPEEVNRRITGVIADIHFAPTKWAADNLRKEGIADNTIFITGNPVIDAVKQVANIAFDPKGTILENIPFNSKKIILVTAHRRENFGKGIKEICGALQVIAKTYDDCQIVYPVHLNPNIWEPVHQLLINIPNITLFQPLEYLPLVYLMKHAYLVVTDSGGIQEEAPAFGVPVLVFRDVTERPEGMKSGTVKVVGTSCERIIAEITKLIEDTSEYNRMAQSINPYGDGNAAQRIVSILLGTPIKPWQG